MDYKQPKYSRIKQDIIRSIKEGTLKPGDKVDSESVLKKKYNVSAITVRKAFADLIGEGYLKGVQGVGTFVAQKQMIRGLTAISFNEELLSQGYRTDLIVDRIDTIVNESIAQKLEIPVHMPITMVCRVRLVNEQPVAYQCSYIDARLLLETEAKQIEYTKSFYETLHNKGIYPVCATENYSVREIFSERIAQLMKLKKGSMQFFVKRIAYDEQDRVVEYAETYFNREWHSVTVHVKIK